MPDSLNEMKTYFEQIADVCGRMPFGEMNRALEILKEAYVNGGTVYTMGNGGHANTAAHMINDLAKHTTSSDDKTAVVAEEQKRFRTICLNDSVSFITGIANDMGYDQIFAEQLINLVEPGDVVIGVSGTGVKRFITVRKISFGEGVERVFPLYSTNIDSIEVVRRGRVRRAKLYYLRDRRGKSARIAENTTYKAKV